MEPQKKKNPWKLVNSIILLLHIVFPVWIMPLICTSGISGKLLPVTVILVLLPGVCSMLVKKYNKGGKLLIAARVLAVFALCLFYAPLLMISGFTRNQLLYPVKRAVYIHGVYGDNGAYYAQLLPETLPEACSDYSFRTQGSFPAQDYHPSSFLTFYTDTATLEAYARFYEQLDCQRLVYNPEAEDGDQDNHHMEWFCGQMKLDQTLTEHMVLYWFDGRYPKGILLDEETGLVAVLT
ncbi:hypothetical protein [Ruminococcus sp.]|uniref:hypothetical protein n=1 Tax=Ruminococcus sp. TaxID=41978 RepID=UPI0025E889D5|nr:hypothetical protein [Ruminococcus sp.]MCI5816040.1 hypothetical protein [Ruminococcus sp.]